MAEETTSPTPAPASAEPPKKGGKLKKIAIGFGVLLVVAVLVGQAVLPGVIKGQVETKGSAILGVPVKVGDVDLSILSGGVEVTDFTIAQPEGFGTDPLLSVGEAEVGVSISALIAGNITIEKVKVKKQAVVLVRDAKGRTSYDVLMANVEKNAPKSDGKDSGGDKGAKDKEREVRLDRLNIQDYTLVFRDAEKGEFAIAYGEFTMKDIVIVPNSKNEAWFTMKLENFAVAGPTGGGWTTKHPFELETMTFEADLASFMAKKPHIRSIKVEKPVIRAEQKPDETTNFQAIAEIAQAFKPAEPEAAAGDGTKKPDDGADKPKEGESLPPAPYNLDALEVSGGLLEAILPGGEAGTQTFFVKDIGVDVRDMAYPAVAGKPGQVTLRCAPLADDAKLAVKILGDLSVATENDRDIAIDVDLKNFPLDTLSQVRPGDKGFQKGDLDAKVSGTLKSSKIDSKAEFVGRELKLISGKKGKDGKDAGGLLGGFGSVLNDSAIAGIEKPGTNETVPIRFKLQMDYDKMSPEKRRDAIRDSIMDGFMNTIANAATLKAEALVTGAGEAVIGGATDVVGGAAGAATDVVGGAAGAATDAIGGLLGGGKKETAEEKAAREAEEKAAKDAKAAKKKADKKAKEDAKKAAAEKTP